MTSLAVVALAQMLDGAFATAQELNEDEQARFLRHAKARLLHFQAHPDEPLIYGDSLLEEESTLSTPAERAVAGISRYVRTISHVTSVGHALAEVCAGVANAAVKACPHAERIQFAEHLRSLADHVERSSR